MVRFFFAEERVLFTSTYPPCDAAQALLDTACAAVRLTYVAVLGTVSESAYEAG